MSYNEIIDYLADLQNNFPIHAKVVYSGYSFEERFLKYIVIKHVDQVENKKVVFVDGGMYGRDWITVSTALYVICQLVENFEENQDLLKTYDWVVVPLINPDSYEFTRSNPSNRLWMKTRKTYGEYFGADPNRNFDFMFNTKEIFNYPSQDFFTGPYAFSEPEVLAMGNILHFFKGRLAFYLTLRSFGKNILYPWRFSTYSTSNDKVFFAVARAGAYAIYLHSGRKYRVGNFGKMRPISGGGSMDYAYAVCDAKIAITLELPGGGCTGFDPPPNSIRQYVKEAWMAITAMAKISELYQ